MKFKITTAVIKQMHSKANNDSTQNFGNVSFYILEEQCRQKKY